MEIKVLGTGCLKCNKLESMVKEVVKENNVEATVKKVSNFMDIAKAGVTNTPALTINGKVKVAGTLPSKEELTRIIKEA